MANLKDIRNRIDSVKNTRKITKAMKMVAAAKLQKAQERMEASRPYTHRMARMIDGLAHRIDPDAHPLLEKRDEPDETLVIVIGSNRGLCGGFNSNLFRSVDRYLDEQRIAGEEQKLCVVGQKPHNHYKKLDYEIVQYYPDIIDDITFKGAQRIAKYAMESFLEGDVDNVFICYNRFVSAIKTDWVIARLLPLSMLTEVTAASDEDTDFDEAPGQQSTDESEGEYIYEPDVDTLLENLLPSFVDAQIMQALMESEASEQAQRMTAMDNATQNANEMIEDLTLEYNRARQAQITTEIVEIVSGAEALEG